MEEKEKLEIEDLNEEDEDLTLSQFRFKKKGDEIIGMY